MISHTTTEGLTSTEDLTTHTSSDETSTTSPKLDESPTTVIHQDHHEEPQGEHYEAIHAPMHSDYPDYSSQYHHSLDGDDHMNATLQNQLSLIAQIKHGRYLMAQPDFAENGFPRAMELNTWARSSSWTVCSRFQIIFMALNLIFL